MKAQNYDIKANALFNGVGHVESLGEYAGEFTQEAYDILDIEGELEGDEWCDIMVAAPRGENGKIYAVAGDSEATQFGEFFFKEIFDGVKGDGEILEQIGREIAKYNVYYAGTDCVDYSVRFIKLQNDMIVVYNTKESEAYISSEEELEEAREQYSEEGGYCD